ncbi:MAG TPA: hypothetical protein DDX54_03600 [Rhodospirillaceae bacterium]|jgi:hypothetical protein|nr:hypothetical protein [Alphaproteobacteria bacterium]HBH26469.1 hypothetical protein [Rhodospirillaceae bacterium]
MAGEGANTDTAYVERLLAAFKVKADVDPSNLPALNAALGGVVGKVNTLMKLQHLQDVLTATLSGESSPPAPEPLVYDAAVGLDRATYEALQARLGGLGGGDMELNDGVRALMNKVGVDPDALKNLAPDIPEVVEALGRVYRLSGEVAPAVQPAPKPEPAADPAPEPAAPEKAQPAPEAATGAKTMAVTFAENALPGVVPPNETPPAVEEPASPVNMGPDPARVAALAAREEAATPVVDAASAEEAARVAQLAALEAAAQTALGELTDAQLTELGLNGLSWQEQIARLGAFATLGGEVGAPGQADGFFGHMALFNRASGAIGDIDGILTKEEVAKITPETLAELGITPEQITGLALISQGLAEADPDFAEEAGKFRLQNRDLIAAVLPNLMPKGMSADTMASIMPTIMPALERALPLIGVLAAVAQWVMETISNHSGDPGAAPKLAPAP